MKYQATVDHTSRFHLVAQTQRPGNKSIRYIFSDEDILYLRKHGTTHYAE